MQVNPTITAAEIARLAGVGRAAVSNWRKRHPAFPTPVGGTAASPEFDLIAVEQWLRAQGKLPEVSQADRLWRRVAAVTENPAAAIADIGARLLARQRGGRVPRQLAEPTLKALLPEVDALAEALGPPVAFDELWQRFSTSGAGRPASTPDQLADLMAALAAAGDGTVFDPAAGTGAALRAAVRAGCTTAYGQEIDPDLARLANLWLALRDVPADVRPGDSLRADAHPGQTVDAVVCHPPFGLTNWGSEELSYDPRWEYGGVPPRTEPELAWVQHCLAHLRPGGYAVLLMPPTVAGRRAGRRFRAELLRRGALRAVIALPSGVAAPHGVPLHLWVLRRPAPDAPAPARALLVDATEDDLPDRILSVWQEFTAGEEIEEVGFARAVPVIELLDEEVDLTPARRQPTTADGRTGERLLHTRDRLAAVVAALPALIPHAEPTPDGANPPLVTVAELARSGALHLLGPVRAATDPAGDDDPGAPVLTVSDVLAGGDASGAADDRLGQRVVLAAGDVVVPMVARALTARVVTAAGARLGRNLYLLRPNPAALDPWFLAGQLRTSANERQTSSLSGTLRFDVRRALVRRLPLVEQRAYGEAFRRLAAFESALGRAASLGAELAQLTADGLARGSLRPTTD
ncbi:HsdM family class I SAM-dependent methyltransferase [Micromonospora sp. LOL_024]|uniref:HsdM family class I SAM-dependent methyltransferase n=1 Tax=Micromonospora sp. LOL_024 TaxID=3345412 RepID=UPI003A8484FC